jgi:hypothetical protein
MTKTEDETIDNAIATLQATGNEDLASDLSKIITRLMRGSAARLDELRKTVSQLDRTERELERVKKIAMHRLEVLAARQIALTEIDDAIAVELAGRIPLNSSILIHNTHNLSEEPPMDHEMDHGYRGAIRDREREQLDGMIAKNNEWLDAHGARYIVGGV